MWVGGFSRPYENLQGTDLLQAHNWKMVCVGVGVGVCVCVCVCVCECVCGCVCECVCGWVDSHVRMRTFRGQTCYKLTTSKWCVCVCVCVWF